MFSNIWNPFIHLSSSSEQEEPLDLSVKNQNMHLKRENVKNLEKTFDFAKFYYTYDQISSRTLLVYPSSYEAFGPIETSLTPVIKINETRKRKSLSSSSETESDDSLSGEEKKIRLENDNKGTKTKSLKKNSHKENINIKGKHLSSLKDSCDCRFCYEDHIIKMRLKTEKPWMSSSQ